MHQSITSVLKKCVDSNIPCGILSRVWSNHHGSIASNGKILVIVGTPLAEVDGVRQELFDDNGKSDNLLFPPIPDVIWAKGEDATITKATLEKIVSDSTERFEAALNKWCVDKEKHSEDYNKVLVWHSARSKAIREVYKHRLAEIDARGGLSPREKRVLKREAAIDRDYNLKANAREKSRYPTIYEKPIRGLGVTMTDCGRRLAFNGGYVALMLRLYNIKKRGPAVLYLAHRGALALVFDDVKMLIMPISLPN